ncbi:ion transporter [Spirillospora sp. CA-294931]|uniref:ion transporter n=1 Tax=Spirillospora sp. CA-294931 TaxID=3240042 RepID=UPI003D8A01B2
MAKYDEFLQPAGYAAPVSPRARVRAVVDAPGFQHAVTALILFNAATLGAEAVPAVEERFGRALAVVDQLALALFTAELAARVFAHGRAFFREPWNLFDAVVVGIALLPHSGGLSVLRSLRILRALRLISAVPSMRGVVEALLSALPGMASIAGLLGLLLYVSAVMATKLFAPIAPEAFGDLGASLFTLFQMMTGEPWPEPVAEVMDAMPLAWIFFAVFILVSTFAVLNLFIAVIVSAMESRVQDDLADNIEKLDEREHRSDALMVEELRRLGGEVAALRAELRAAGSGPREPGRPPLQEAE